MWKLLHVFVVIDWFLYNINESTNFTKMSKKNVVEGSAIPLKYLSVPQCTTFYKVMETKLMSFVNSLEENFHVLFCRNGL